MFVKQAKSNLLRYDIFFQTVFFYDYIKITTCFVSAKLQLFKIFRKIVLLLIDNLLVFIQGVKMASRYNQEYFFQDLLMNIPFTNLNDIIYTNAENIPDTLRHFASAMFTNGCYWNDAHKIRHDLKTECHNSDNVLTYLSYISMMKASYNLYSRGFLIFTIDFTLYSHFFLSICKCNV